MANKYVDPVSRVSSTITDLVSCYDILSSLASCMSTVDLYHLALANRTHFSHILASPNIFRALRRHCLCDGHGLLKRQTWSYPYTSNPLAGNLSSRPQNDEEIEVFVYNVKCDETDVLPCAKCGINVCEECRYYPRAAPETPNRRPHMSSTSHFGNIMCLCVGCDAIAEEKTSGKFLNQLCDCDRYTRWVCTRCTMEEHQFASWYKRERTVWEYDWVGDEITDEYMPSKCVEDHGYYRVFWCVCGNRVGQDTRPRCTWCNRQHLSESEWSREWHDVGSKMPYFDKNPHYPRWAIDPITKRYPIPYPELGPVEYDDDEEDFV